MESLLHEHSEQGCCQTWWDGLSEVQKLLLHTKLWDINIFSGWGSSMMVNNLVDYHDKLMKRDAEEQQQPLNDAVGAQ